MKRLWLDLVVAWSWSGNAVHGTRCPQEMVGYQCQRSSVPHRTHIHVLDSGFIKWNWSK